MIYLKTVRTMSKLSFTTPCIILLSFFFFFFYLATIPVKCSNNETDFQALVAFKNAIHDPQGVLNSWNETFHFCTWQGILCNYSRVVEINLMSQGLVGTISPHLGNLSFLTSIFLQNNAFYGRIPNEIGRLTSLELVGFNNNSLSGEIPRNISQCTNISYLNLFKNNLTGVIPLDLSSLMKLKYLELSENKLSGTIPPFIGNFSRLESLDISCAGMQGQIPESLVQLKSLRYLSVSGNNLTGSVPTGLFNISIMSVCLLSSNRLEGIIPSEIGSTYSILRRLYLWDNFFTGEIPTSLSNVSSLEKLLLASNMFSGRVIDLSRFSALRILTLGENMLEGDLNFVSSMANCTQLTSLYVNSNHLSGTLPHSIANLSRSLSSLSFSHNRLYGRIPPGIGDLSSLTAIYLSDNDLDGPIPSEIGKLDKLQELSLSRNKFTSEIPSSFGNLTSLTYLYLGRNNLYGNVPQSLSNCTKMLDFNISYNNLNGSIPPQVMNHLTGSRFFDLSHNAFSGTIPDEVGSLINLGYLDLSYNRLSGHVPGSLSSCVRLEEIYLQSNSFYGEIADKLNTLRGLQRVDLSRNNLSGIIPKFLGELELFYLNLSFNRLEGSVPSCGVFLNESALSLEGNKDLCGGIPSLNFTPCSIENSRRNCFPLAFKVLILIVGVGAIALACLFVFICRQRRSKDTRASNTVSLEDWHFRLSYADLVKSTGGFSESNLIGSGRFGSVYKGVLYDLQTMVAVKVFHLKVKGASKSFMSECNALRRIRHRNLVKILSLCSSSDFQGSEFKALVYEFMANGNLDEWLHQKPGDGNKTLSLRQRLDIAIDIASALEYLHSGTGTTIVHGDLKPSNVLLDEDMTARVADFGLAKIVSKVFSTNESSTSIGIRGTIGYIPPEYGISGAVSTQGDVYSCGILLLEMFTGRRPTDDDFKDSWCLPDFVKTALAASQVMTILDTNLIQESNEKMNIMKYTDCVISILEIGVACSMEFPKDRMAISNVVKQLQKASRLFDES